MYIVTGPGQSSPLPKIAYAPGAALGSPCNFGREHRNPGLKPRQSSAQRFTSESFVSSGVSVALSKNRR